MNKTKAFLAQQISFSLSNKSAVLECLEEVQAAEEEIRRLRAERLMICSAVRHGTESDNPEQCVNDVALIIGINK
jgi:hypothetical protein